uniref:Uncharacterized protein n=1 Tax=Nelumbo nucifera TaxID=4432 RepID=A0A822YQH1_NELNU|nr:TPA_asm: hypothetical protein HUJ06_005003 [Nelumbo nucifera]
MTPFFFLLAIFGCEIKIPSLSYTTCFFFCFVYGLFIVSSSVFIFGVMALHFGSHLVILSGQVQGGVKLSHWLKRTESLSSNLVLSDNWLMLQ